MGSAIENFNTWLKRVSNLSLWDVCSLAFMKSSGWGTGKTDSQPFPWACTTGNEERSLCLLARACLFNNCLHMSREIWSEVCFHDNQVPRSDFCSCPLMSKRTVLLGSTWCRAGLWALALWTIWSQEGFLIPSFAVLAAQKLWWLTIANSYFSALALPLSYGYAMPLLFLAGLHTRLLCRVESISDLISEVRFYNSQSS